MKVIDIVERIGYLYGEYCMYNKEPPEHVEKRLRELEAENSKWEDKIDEVEEKYKNESESERLQAIEEVLQTETNMDKKDL